MKIRFVTAILLSAFAALTLLLPNEAAAQIREQNRLAGSDANASKSLKVAAEKLAQVFPRLYWYSSDACLRETTRHGVGQLEIKDDFVKRNKAVIDRIEGKEPQGGKQSTIRLRLQDPKVPDEYWVLEFELKGNLWEPKTGYKYMNGKLAFDLFQDEYLAGVKIMGSMKPYFQAALSAYSQGKDFSAVFTNSRKSKAEDSPLNFRAGKLVGHWRHADIARKLATNITFNSDGTFVGSIEQNGKASGSFSGKRMLKDGIVNYEYTATSDPRIHAGTKDQDQIMVITKDRYTIQNAAGLFETYIRME